VTAAPTATQLWYGVFLWAKNQTSQAQTTTDNFDIVDTQEDPPLGQRATGGEERGLAGREQDELRVGVTARDDRPVVHHQHACRGVREQRRHQVGAFAQVRCAVRRRPGQRELG